MLAFFHYEAVKGLEHAVKKWETEMQVEKYVKTVKEAMPVLGALYSLIAEVKLCNQLGDSQKAVNVRKRAVEEELGRVAKFSKTFATKIRPSLLPIISDECDSLLTAA